MWLNYLKICMQNISAQFVVNETFLIWYNTTMG